MSSSCERVEWVEIIEPRTKEHMYANLTTGECVWDPPEDVPIKRTDSSQWWELFDTNTQRFYYYNAATQKTVWHRPSKCDIIPLAKLQTLKQNTDPNDRRDNYTQTQATHIAKPARVPRTASCGGHGGGGGGSDLGRGGGGGGLSCGSSGGSTNKHSSGSTDSHFKTSMPVHASSEEKLATDLLSSPRGRQSFRIGSGNSTRSMDVQQYTSRRSQDSFNHYRESGKSSDSSLSSIHGYRRFNDGSTNESLRLGSLQKQRSRKESGSGSFDMLQESASSHNLPHTASFVGGSGSGAGVDKYCDHQLLPSHLQGPAPGSTISPTHSITTPQPKKKLSPDGIKSAQQQQYQQYQFQQHRAGGSSGVKSLASQSSHHVLDFAERERERDNNVALARSGSFMSSSINAAAPHVKVHRKSSTEAANGGAASDDSMHEKYFKSVENTPVSRRRHAAAAGKATVTGSSVGGNSSNCHKKTSSDSSPHSPISPQPKSKPKSAANSLTTLLSSPGHAPSFCVSSHSPQYFKRQETVAAAGAISNVDFLNVDNIKRIAPTSPSLSDAAVAAASISAIPMRNFPSSDNICMLTHSSKSSNESRKPKSRSQQTSETRSIGSLRHNSANLDKSSKHSIDHYYDKRNKAGARRTISRHHQNHLTADSSDVEYDNGNTSPLYSNWDQEMQEHLLPLKHYIIEQAKLSGRYMYGDPIDSDSYHSDSQSEHSLSGHEPDNEDSDHSERGGYLEHNYGMIDDYTNMGDSISYYAYQYPPYDTSGREDISDNVEAVLEGIGSADACNKVKPRYQLSFYDTSNSAQSYKQQQQQQQHQQLLHQQQQHYDQKQQQLYSNQPASHLQHLPLDTTTDSNKHKQSQTLPSPNRQISRIAQSALDGLNRLNVAAGAHYPKDSDNIVASVSSVTMNRQVPPPPLKPTIQQIFPSAERAPQGLGGIPTLACMKECDIEKFAADNLNLHSKGIFRKKSSVRDMLSWTGEAISRPMLALSRDKTEKKIAIELFKLVQIYMGDRKARAGMSLNSVAIDIITSSLPQQQLRDELYVQLCRQTTENPKRESLIRGWELMAICLSFVPPSPTFQPTLLNYVNRHRDSSFAISFPEVGKWPIHVQISHYATVCCRRLERIGSRGRKQAKKPTDDEVEQARNQILRNSMFGNTLSEVMELQKDKFEYRKLPWIQTTLSEHVLLLNGKQTEGIFRVSADVDEVNCLKNRLDRWEVPEYKNTMDAHAPASLLKLWYRELYDPLIPDEFYEDCVNTEDPAKAKEIVEKLPDLNKLVLTYLIHFLQQFSHPDVVSCTKMDSSNLAMVFAPNCLRCTSDDPKVILENARKEMSFMRTLIQHMDTSHVASLA